MMEADNLITEVISNAHKGRSLNELSAKLREVVSAAQSTGKVGSLTIKLRIVPRGEHQIDAGITASAKCPSVDHGASIFFVTDEGGLSRHDPGQPDLPFGQVDSTPPAAQAAGGQSNTESTAS